MEVVVVILASDHGEEDPKHAVLSQAGGPPCWGAKNSLAPSPLCELLALPQFESRWSLMRATATQLPHTGQSVKRLPRRRGTSIAADDLRLSPRNFSMRGSGRG